MDMPKPVKERQDLNKGIISEILLSHAKGQPVESVPRVNALTDMGLEGDRFCDGSDRQISLMAEDLQKWMKAQEIQGVCFRRYKGNLMVNGEDPSAWKKGTLLKVGNANLKVTISHKECFPECERLSKGMECRLRNGCCYARVIKGGTISVGDEIRRILDVQESDPKRSKER